MPNSPTQPFPLYLLPSIPFRRRSSTTTASTASTPSSSPPHPTSFLSTTPTSHLRCHKCLTDLIPTSSIISKGFTGRHGRAYLVSPPSPPSALHAFLRGGSLDATGWSKGDIPNTFTHKPVPRQLVTGAHTVSDISCRSCGSVLGWKYVHAEEEGQRYKVGKFILETKRVVKSLGWEDGDGDGDCVKEIGGVVEGKMRGEDDGDEDVEFDSQDEDECEDLFSGIWSPQLARRRRKGRAF
ncbi:yippee zinc-binding/DNA-binding /Mis18, centromere assembly-domain-containing protein [Paraphoma chrysanthemicola]|uniref:Yippee zinc-binding/DNA-binding /Mis18, centromere assembly-domain-containing protein n=1 Tax=Paraphoma chrysanthemicola TaxID=798071 RepID=A0A8K0VUC5_9PLEO|nr:yippee zinc-binding/DNA-binding /Mis18, centromere assembly-domain-containing protein [Paraphoma chrysanthemicola]